MRFIGMLVFRTEYKKPMYQVTRTMEFFATTTSICLPRNEEARGCPMTLALLGLCYLIRGVAYGLWGWYFRSAVTANNTATTHANIFRSNLSRKASQTPNIPSF